MYIICTSIYTYIHTYVYIYKYILVEPWFVNVCQRFWVKISASVLSSHIHHTYRFSDLSRVDMSSNRSSRDDDPFLFAMKDFTLRCILELVVSWVATVLSPTTPSCGPAWNKPTTWKDFISFGKDSSRWKLCINMHLRYSGSDDAHDALYVYYGSVQSLAPVQVFYATSFFWAF